MTHSLNTLRRGSTLIVTMWVIIALAGLVLVMSYSMRTEAVAGANRTAQAQADAAERGAEQFLLSVVDAEVTTPGSLDDYSMEARQIGDCLVWVVKPDPDNQENQLYGLIDEAGKIDLNTATRDMLIKLPGMTDEAADSIVDWRDSDSSVTDQGAEDDYYLSLPEPYRCKNGPLESVEELLLVKGITHELLYNYDRNHNGMLDARELQSGSAATAFNSDSGAGRGIFPFVTVYGIQATVKSSSSSSTTSSSSSSTPSVADVNSRNTTTLQTVLKNVLSGSRLDQILQFTPRNQPYANVFDYYFRAGLTMDEFTKLYPRLTAKPPTTGQTESSVAKVNVNTAPPEVLLCLPNLDANDVAAITGYRQNSSSSDPSNLAWLAQVLPREKAIGIGALVTGVSTCFCGDIVALSPDGRAFRRFRVVIDGRTPPAKIIYRRDLTGSGWSLPPEIRNDIRSGLRLENTNQLPAKGGSAS